MQGILRLGLLLMGVVSKGGVDLKYDSDTSVNYATEAMRLAAEAMRTILEKYNGFGKSG
jgi:hypothetical protein